MQRKQIKVGEAYAVTSPSASVKRYGEQAVVKATVVRMDAAVERGSRYSTYTELNGIEVKFDHLVEFNYFGAQRAGRHSGTKHKTYTFKDGRAFQRTWDEQVRHEAETKKWVAEQHATAESQHAAFKPVLDAFAAKLKSLGIKGKLRVTPDASGGDYGDGVDFKFYRGVLADGTYVPTGFDYNAIRLTSDAAHQVFGIPKSEGVDE